jgi:hypothetical protein
MYQRPIRALRPRTKSLSDPDARVIREAQPRPVVAAMAAGLAAPATAASSLDGISAVVPSRGAGRSSASPIGHFRDDRMSGRVYVVGTGHTMSQSTCSILL